MKYLRLYDYVSEHAADTAHFTENKYSTCYMQKDKVVDYHTKQAPRMSVAELVDAGYAELKQDRSEVSPGGETAWTIVQVSSACPISLENITDFDTWLTSATTFVWRESLPDGWDPVALAEKYDEVPLARPLMVEMFSRVDMSSVSSLTLSFSSASWNWPQSSVLTQRRRGATPPGVTLKTPQNVTIKIRGNYGSVAQTSFSRFGTTTAITLDFDGDFKPHDANGLFEGDGSLVTLNINRVNWSEILACANMFEFCESLTAIPYSSQWTREDAKNILYPHSNGQRGDACCSGMFKAPALTYIGPVINMKAISLSGATVDGVEQKALTYDGNPMFRCPVCTDVRIINLNNNDWNFADESTYTRLPNMDKDSIEYLLNNVYDCSDNRHTVTFSNLHQNDVSQTAIDAADAKGWTVAWQAI